MNVITRMLIILTGAALFFLWMGTSEMRDAQVYKHPKDVTLAQLASQKPEDGYYTVHGGVLNLFDAAKKADPSDKDSDPTYFVPLIRPNDDPLRAKSHVLVAVNDPKLIKTIEEGLKLPDKASDAQVTRFLEQHIASMLVTRNVSGRVTPSAFDTFRLSNDGSNIDKFAVVIDERISLPSPGAGVGETWFGVILAALAAAIFAFMMRIKRQPSGWVPTTFPRQPNIPAGNQEQPYYADKSARSTGIAQPGVDSKSPENPWWEQSRGVSPSDKK